MGSLHRGACGFLPASLPASPAYTETPGLRDPAGLPLCLPCQLCCACCLPPGRGAAPQHSRHPHFLSSPGLCLLIRVTGRHCPSLLGRGRRQQAASSQCTLAALTDGISCVACCGLATQETPCVPVASHNRIWPVEPDPILGALSYRGAGLAPGTSVPLKIFRLPVHKVTSCCFFYVTVLLCFQSWESCLFFRSGGGRADWDGVR